MRKIYLFLEPLIIFLVKKIPVKLLLRIKQNTHLVKKMDYSRHDIFLNIDSTFENHARPISCASEPETVRWIETFFRRGEIFYDVGANVGAYSFIAAKFFEGNIKIYAFEPAFMTYAQLCRNILLNNCEDCITPLPIALSDKTMIDTFNYHNMATGSSIHALGEAIDDRGRPFEPIAKQRVLAFSIDDIIRQFTIPIPNHIKIDVDGIELLILKGAETTLGNPHVKSILLELQKGDAETRTAVEFLRSKGFEFHSKHQSRNYIFVKKEH